MDDPKDTSRTSVKTYLPKYQKARWQTDADEADMSMSEFVRCMVQAGRRGFETHAEGPSQHATPRGRSREDKVIDHLDDGPKSFDELVDATLTEIEMELETALENLEEAGRIQQDMRGRFELSTGSRQEDG